MIKYKNRKFEDKKLRYHRKKVLCGEARETIIDDEGALRI